MAYRTWQREAEIASRFMDSVGDGTGSVAMNINASATPVFFFTRPSPGCVLFVHRVMPSILDNGIPGTDTFGSMSALTNGVNFGIYDFNTSTFLNRTIQKPIRKNSDFAMYSYDMNFITQGSNHSVLNEYSYVKDGHPLVIRDYQAYAVQIQDDLTGVLDLSVRVGCVQYHLSA